MADKLEFKPKFIERYSKLTDWKQFEDYSTRWLRRSIRVNTLKISVKDLVRRLEKDWILEPIPWCKEGFWIEYRAEEKRRDIGNLLEHTLGYIYIQEAVSMIPPIALGPKPGETVLDMCAAPGSKTTQIAQYMENTGVLVANDYRGIRIAPLGLNLQRMGVINAITTLMEGRWFKDMEFDKVLVDAPCSGTGTIRKSLKTIYMWNANMIKKLAGAQKQLIKAGFDVLKPGGTMVYSTCSCEPHENEAVVDHLLRERKDAELVDIKLPIKRGDAVIEFEGNVYSEEVKKCLRLWPQDNDTEGFFVCKIKKLPL